MFTPNGEQVSVECDVVYRTELAKIVEFVVQNLPL
jgi:hypothetical protein